MGYRIPVDADGWNEAWKARQARRDAPHGADFWDERAKSFTTKDAPGCYTDQFLQMAAVRPGETVFDMGCGTGNLAVPLGAAGHEVCAADFSPVMLDRLREELRHQGITCVRPVQLSWEDDWAAHGIEAQSFDVCVASRSIATADLGDALAKLTAVARRRTCITLACGISPRIDDGMLRAIGIEAPPAYDFIYALAILHARGFLPELRYISTERRDTFATFDEAYRKYATMVKAVMRDESPERAHALERLRAWLDRELTGQDGALTLRQPRQVPWAFISWDRSAQSA